MSVKRIALVLNHLIKSKAYSDFSRAFRHTTGLSIHLIPPDPTEKTKIERHSRFCRLVETVPKTCARCQCVDESLKVANLQRPRTATCFAGLCETAVPVRSGNETIALLRTGEVSLTPLTPRTFAAFMQRLGDESKDIDLIRLEKAYFLTPVVVWRDYEEIVRLLTVFATQLSALAAQAPGANSENEPKEIVRARRFIEENFQEPIRLKEVAVAANMSEYYFCRRFREITGATFSDYLTRTRLEKARCLLAEPERRISEVAFEVGFQSLSQFNRSFRKIFGCSPKDVRLLNALPLAKAVSK